MKLVNIIFLLLITNGLISCSGSENEPAWAIAEQQEEKEETTDNSSEQSQSEMTSAEYSCGAADHSKVGKMAVFTTRHHQVDGQALIIDNCTIEVSSFTYDGEGPDVLFYGGIDGDYKATGAGFALSDNINGRSYDNETLTIELNNPMVLDRMNGISVWYVDFDVSFSDGLFQ
ncbi:MAG: DM13 domain-containing protein [Gammaproteobacteria bacterium]|nr:DM13 domain-containing protein [Gammaproteobacteria bacterium]